METITYLQLRTSISSIRTIEKLVITQYVNQHAYLTLTGILNQENDDYILKIKENEEIEIFTEGDEKTLFKGLILSASIKVKNNTRYLEIKGASYSYLMDLENKSRSFQNPEMTYNEIVKNITRNYDGGDVMDNCFKGKTIRELSVQYQETDWEYLKRLASHFHVGITPSVLYSSPKLIFGNVEGKNIGQLQEYNYYLTKDMGRYLKSKKNTVDELTELDAVVLSIETNREYEIGDMALFQNICMYVKSKEMEMIKGILLFRYNLTTENGLWVDEIYNDRIVGVSLLGEVIERVMDKVKVKLEIDSLQNPDEAWLFPYATYYTAQGHSGCYCMPEIGDMVNIYFPDKNEKHAVGMDCIRVCPTVSDKIYDPDVKYFRTADGKELMFNEKEICITCCNHDGENIYLRLNEDSGIEIHSTKPIQLKSDENITLQAEKNINIKAAEELSLRGKSGEIVLNSMIEINGDDVRIN